MAKFYFEVVGSSDAQDLAVTKTFSPDGKIEYTVKDITSLTAAITIPVTGITNPQYMIVNSTDAKISFTQNSVDNVILVNGLLILDCSSSFSSITIETTSASEVDVYIAIYGEAA